MGGYFCFDSHAGAVIKLMNLRQLKAVVQRVVITALDFKHVNAKLEP